MDYKKVLLPLFLLMVMASVYADSDTLAVLINTPADGKTFQPNLVEDDKCVIVDFNVWDINASRAIHIADIYYDHPADSNTFIWDDQNLDTSVCNFYTDYVWGSNGGAECSVYYCWASASTTPSGTYDLNINVSAYHVSTSTLGLDQNSNMGYNDSNSIVQFTIDNRYISASVEALMNVIPIVLVAAMIIVATLGLMGIVSPRTVIILLPGLILVLISLLIIGTIINTLTGRPG